MLGCHVRLLEFPHVALRNAYEAAIKPDLDHCGAVIADHYAWKATVAGNFLAYSEFLAYYSALFCKCGFHVASVEHGLSCALLGQGVKLFLQVLQLPAP